MKILIKLVALLQIFCFLTACTQTTTGIWKKPEYKESISQFLATKDGGKLVFVGKKYHYVFSDASSLVDILTWDSRELLVGTFDKSFRVDSSNKIDGSYIIDCLCDKAKESQIQWLKSKGFTKNNKHQQGNNGATYRKEGNISGIRYLSGDVEFHNTAGLNNNYEIWVETEHTPSGVLGRIAFTPIAIAEDGVATIGLAALLVIGTPFAIADKIFTQEGSK